MELENKLYIVALLDLYSGLLTPTKAEIMQSYYLSDIALSEIAETRNMSRQAVYDCVQSSTKKLKSFESKLQLFSLKQQLSQGLEQIANNSSDQKSKDIAKNLLKKL